jgi:sulfoxide reductase catalytic subunit YedY
MPNIRHRRGWEIPDRLVTPESVYMNRRAFMKALGLGAIALTLPGGCARAESSGPTFGPTTLPASRTAIYPAKRNEKFKLDRALTDESVAAKYNNFYEFTTNKERVAELCTKFNTVPWTIEVAGLVKEPRVIDLDDLLKRMPIEERLYRHRCVEAWAMAVPWTGFSMKSLIDYLQPQSSAKYIRFITAARPSEMPGWNSPSYVKAWPYYEGLRMDEATSEIAFFATGIYGHALPNQHGAPFRAVVPWKYGYKSAKSIARIEFVEKQPHTFWEDQEPDEYPFESNVNPDKPHPRWSQATERLIDTGRVVPTQKYNGYGEFVGHLYA